MSTGYKVRLADGSEIGPMDLDAVGDWYRQGLIDADSLVLTPRGKRWIPLRHAIPRLLEAAPREGSAAEASDDLRAAVRAATRGRRRRGTGAGASEPAVAAPLETQPWRTVVAGVLLLLAAAGSVFWMLYPYRWIAALDAVTWREVGLALGALGLALVRGWELSRKIIRPLLLLVACLLFPVAGILVVQRLPWAALAVVASALVLLIGLFLWLAKGHFSALRVVTILLVILVGVAGIVHFGLVPERPEVAQIRQWARAERALGDPVSGMWLNLPEPWVALDAKQDLIPAGEGTRLVLAEPRRGGRAVLLAVSPRRVLSVDEFLDRALLERSLPARKEQARTDVVLGELLGRKAESLWERDGSRYRDLTIAARDGGTYWSLSAWMPDDGSSRPAEDLDVLASGLVLDGKMAAQLAEAVAATIEGVPFLTNTAAEAVIAFAADANPDPSTAFRHTLELLDRGRPALSRGEAADLQKLEGLIERQLSRGDRRRWRLYTARVREAQGTHPEDDRAMAALVAAAVLELPAAYQERLQDIVEKAVTAQPRS